MKKALIALLVLGAAAFAGWWFFLRAQGTPPGLATGLEAAHTAGFISIEGPEVLASEAAAAVARMTEKASPEVKAVVSADALAQVLHFDPRKAEGWQGIGLDPKVGLALVNDIRLKGEPVVLLGLAEQTKFLSWIEKLQGQAPRYEEGNPAVLTIGDRRYFVGKRAGFTAVMQARDERKDDFLAFLSGSGATVAEADHFKPAFRDSKAGPRATAWIDTAGLAGMAGGDAEAKGVFDYYAALFPGFSFYAGPEAGGMRLLATEKGAEALRQVLMPASSPPKFSAFIPAEGWAALRFSVNLKEIFSGVEALLPPTVPAEAKSQLGMARLGVAMLTGVTWDDLAEAFGGHFVVAGNLSSLAAMQAGKQPEWLAFISATAKADSVIDALVGKVDDLMGGMGGEKVPVEKVTLAGVAARKATLGPLTVVVGRVDDVLVVASSTEVFEAAVARNKAGSGSLKGTPAADAVDGEVVFGAAVPFAALKDMAAQFAGVQATQMLAGIDPGRSHMVHSVGLDKHGLVSKGDGHWVLGAGATLGSFVVPFFVMRPYKADEEARAVAAEAQEAELKALQEAMKAQAPEAAPATEAAPEAPTTEAAPEAPATEAAPEAPATEAAPEAPATDAPRRQPEDEMQ